MKGKFNAIGDLISQSLKNLNLEHKTRERGTLSIWSEVVGTRISKAAEADQIRDGILFVSCKSGTWANELSFMKADIMKKLNEKLGGKFVKDIRFSTRSRRSHDAESQAEEPEKMSEKELEDIQLSVEEEQWIERSAMNAGNEELADRIRKTLTTSRKVEKWKLAHGWKKCGSCGSLFEDGNKKCPVCGE